MPYLDMRGVTKLYSNDLLANDAIDFSVEKNEIHAIVGENGAGKTTLMKILYGLEAPDAGSITLGGNPVTIRSPLDANRLGIGMVHQHFKLIPEFTVAENVVLGIEPRKNGVFVDRNAAVARISEVIQSHGFSIDPRARVLSLTVGQMQQVEIVKMLYRKADLLILDEPTSVLTEQEIRKLFETLRSLQKDGKTCIIITHKLQEVMEISDRVTVMRKGTVIAVRRTAEVDKTELSRLMVGKSVLFQLERAKKACGDAVLELVNVTLKQRRRDRALLEGINLTVRSCEIVGVAGVSGNGLGELEDAVAGLRRITSGRILHNGEDIAGLSPATLRERGFAYVPADRLRRGSSLQSTVTENMIVTSHHRFLRAGFLRGGKIQQFAERLTKSFSIDGGPRVPIGTLSGGNIQKVILARELATASNLVIVSEPTWGLDVASSQFVYEKILEMRKAGAGILFISSNLDEILGIADMIAVMYRGRVVAFLPNVPDLTKERIGEYMLGLRDDFAPPGAAEEGRTAVKVKRNFGELFAGFTGLALTLLLSFALVIGLIFILSRTPGRTIYYFFLGAFTNKYYLGNMLNVAVPLVFTGLGISVAFKSSVFNLGGEGQIYAGGLAATAVCLALPAANGWLGGLSALAGAMVLSGTIAGLSGYFRMKWNTDEMISSFLLSSAVVLVVNYFITGPLDDPKNNLLATLAIGPQYGLLKIFTPSKLNISAFFALAAALLVFLFMYKSHAGYEMRMCGLNREFSRYGGINVSKYLVIPMIMSGALHGLGGGLMVLGTYRATIEGFSWGMGWNGIAVALIAKNNPLGVIPAALLFAYLDAGAKAAMLNSDVTFEIAAIAQSFIFYFVTAQALYGLTRKRRRA